MPESKTPVTLVGLIRIREHCTFTWKEPQGAGCRTVEVRATHCSACVDQLREMGYLLLPVADPDGRT